MVILRFLPSNNYSISSRWEETRVNVAQKMCSAAMLCCSCMTDPSSWYSTCHFLRAGEYSSNTGDLYERETTRRCIITSPTQYTHTYIQTEKERERDTCICILRTCKCCAQCTRPLSSEQNLHVQPHRCTIIFSFKITLNMLHNPSLQTGVT